MKRVVGRDRRWWMLAAVVAVSALSLAAVACSSDDHDGMDMSSGATDTSTSSLSIPANAPFNAADVTFAQEMIVHHQQAIEMADVALQRSQSPEIRSLAEAIKGAQDPEINQMKSWLTEWDQPTSSRSGMDHDMGSMSTGTMMTQDEMNRLDTTANLDFDRMFLEMMIVHHEGAIDMSEVELDDGKFQPAMDLAQQIITAQTAEIATMKSLLDQM